MGTSKTFDRSKTKIGAGAGQVTPQAGLVAKVYDFPKGRIRLLGGRAKFNFNWAGTTIGAGGSGDFSLGSTGTADATLGGTDADMMASTAMLDPFVQGRGNGTGTMVENVSFDGTTNPVDMFLNVIVDDDDVANAQSAIVKITGTIEFVWTNLGE
jgi:hypothetical protein